jgi:chemotaxis signal transduction protein
MDTPEPRKRFPYSTENDYVLQRRAEELAALRKPVDSDARLLLLLRIAGIDFAIDQVHVRQIVSPLTIVPVPFADPCIRGITQTHGELISVIDLSILLGAPQTTGGNARHAVLVDDGDASFCIALDEAPATYSLPVEDVGTDDAYPIDWARPVIDGMFLFDHTRIGLLSIPRLTTHHYLRSLLNAGGTGE